MEKKTAKSLKSAGTGVSAGIVNGFFGGGGGLIIVPLLKRFVKIEIKVSHATAIAIAVMMSIATGIVYLSKGAVSFNDAKFYMIGGAAGGIIGGLLLGKIPKAALRKIFAVFLVFSAVRMLFFG